jgi:hypothetical protein
MPTVSSGNITPGTGAVTYTGTDSTSIAVTGNTATVTTSGTTSQLSLGGQNLGGGYGVFNGIAGSNPVIMDFRTLLAGSGIGISADDQTITLTATGTVSSQLNDLGGVLQVNKGGTGATSFIANAIIAGNGNNAMASLPLPTSTGQVLTWNGATYTWVAPQVSNATGTVTSVSILPGSSGLVTVTGNPITVSGTYVIDVNQSAFNLNNIGGNLSVTKGGTGTNSFNSNGLIYGNGTGALQQVVAPSTAGQVLSYTGSGFAWTTPATVPSNVLTSVSLTGNSVVTVSGGSTGSSSVAYTLTQAPSGVTPGTYTNATVIVDQYGRVTSASNGSTSSVSVSALNENNGGGARIFDDSTSTSTQFNFRRVQTSSALTVTENTGYILLDVNNISVAKGGTGATTFASNGLLVGNGTNAVTTAPAPSTSNTMLTWTGSAYTWTSALQNVTIVGTNGLSSSQSADANGQPVFTLSYSPTSTPINNLSGTLSVTKGGTGQTSLTANGVLLGNGSGNVQSTIAPTAANTALMWNGSGFTWAYIPANALTSFTVTPDGTNTINVTNGAVSSANTTVSVGLANSGVSQGTYTNPTISVDAFGRIISASNGNSSITGGANYTNSGAQILDTSVTGATLKFRTIETSSALTATQNVDNVTIDVANIPVSKGGTGVATIPTNSLIYGNGVASIGTVPAPTTAGTFLTWNGASYSFASALKNVTVTGTGAAVVTPGTDANGQPTYAISINPTQISANNLAGTMNVASGGTGATTFASNGLLAGNGTNPVSAIAVPSTAGTVLTWNGSGYEWDTPVVNPTGLTSVGITPGAGLVVTNSPLTANGNIGISIDTTQLSLNNFAGTLNVTTGGTGATSFTSNGILIGNGTGAIQQIGAPTTAGQVLSWDGTEFAWSTENSGSGTVTSVAITPGSNAINVSGSPITTSGTIVVDVNQANLNIANMSGTLGTTQGGTGLTSIGTAGQILSVTEDGTALTWIDVSSASGGTVTSVAVTGTAGRVAVTGSPITGEGTINVNVIESGLNIGLMGGTLGTAQGGTGVTTLGTAGQVLTVNNGATGLVWTSPLSQINAGSNQVTVSTTAGVATVDVATANMDISTMAGTLSVAHGGTGLTSVGANGQVLTASNGAYTWSTPGTVTSVGITPGATGAISVSGSPITSSGSITVDVIPGNLNISQMTGTLPVNMGGTGLTTYGAPGQVLTVDNTGTTLVWTTPSGGTGGSGTVTSVTLAAGSNAISVSGSPITSSGTITVDVDQANLNLAVMGGTLGTTQGGTGLTTLGSAGQVLTVNSGGNGLVWSSVAGTGTVTSVSLTAGSNLVSVSGSPITTSGAITVDVNPGNFNLAALGGTLGTTQGGTGLTTLGSAGQMLVVNSSTNGFTYATPNAGTVTSVALTANSNKVTITGSAITSSGTYGIDVNTANMDISTMTGTLATTHGGTGLTSIGSAGQILTVNSGGNGLVWATPTNSGTVTSVALAAGSNKVTVSGSPITSNGTLTVDVNPANISLTALGGTLGTSQGGTGLTSVGTANQFLQVNNGGTGLQYTSLTAANVSGLANVATSGSYTDLINTPAAYSLPVASSSVLGGVMVGSGLAINSGVLSATATGTVTSVGITAGSSKVSVTGGPVTTNGSITVDVVPSNISLTALAGTLATTQGGTGLTTIGTAGQVLTVNTAGTALQWSTPASGTGGGNPTNSTASGYFQFAVVLNAGGTSITAINNLPSGWSAVNAGSGVINVTHTVGRAPFAAFTYAANATTGGGSTVWAVMPLTYTQGTFDIPDSGSYGPSTTAFNVTVTSSLAHGVANGTVLVQVMF